MIAVVDYGMGNVGSAVNAMRHVGAECKLTADPADLERATHIILPGVGAFPDGMAELRARGLVSVLEREVLTKKKPFLGICLGMQLLADGGDESGGAEGLGWIHGRTKRLPVDERSVRLPHIGWNDVSFGNSSLFAGIASHDFYFVHSFALVPQDPQVVIGTCNYGVDFAAAVASGNVYGVQFHPEKSQKSGLRLLQNFISL